MYQIDKSKNRIAVLVLYDKEGKVERYVEYILQELVVNTRKIIVVSNGKIQSEGKKILSDYCSEIIERNNEGWDVGAWKDVLTNKIRWEELYLYDELVLLNDTFYGPFYPLNIVFERMKERDVDFWGLLAHGAQQSGANLHFWHIQTYFMVFRKIVFQSECFQRYWESIPDFDSLNDVVDKHERIFTHYLQKNGFKAGVYVDTSDLDLDPDLNIIHYFYNPYELIVERRYPIVKRKLFEMERGGYLNYTDGKDVRRVLDYIQNNTAYDISMIIENLIRIYNSEKVSENLNLKFIIDESIKESNKCKDKMIILVFYITRDNYMCKLLYKHLLFFSAIRVIVLCDSSMMEEKTDIIKKSNISLFSIDKNVGIRNNLKKYLPQIIQYKYCGLLTDLFWQDKSYYTINHLMIKNGIENMCKSEQYINNVVDLFECRCYIGMLESYPVFCGAFYSDNFHCDKSKEIAYGRMNQGFAWYRSELIQKTLLNSDIVMDNELFEWAKYQIKKDGYLTGYIMTRENAENTICVQNYILDKKFKKIRFLNKKNNTFYKDYLLNSIFSGFSITKSIKIFLNHIRKKLK